MTISKHEPTEEIITQDRFHLFISVLKSTDSIYEADEELCVGEPVTQIVAPGYLQGKEQMDSPLLKDTPVNFATVDVDKQDLLASAVLLECSRWPEHRRRTAALVFQKGSHAEVGYGKGA